MSENEHVEFSQEDAVVIRERLIAFKNHSLGKDFARSNRDLISHIIYTNYDENIYDEMINDEENFDKKLPIKEDGFGKFISRKQENLAQEALLEIYNFLISIGYLYYFELPSLVRIVKKRDHAGEIGPQIIITGEYHSLFDAHRTFNSIYRINMLPKTQYIYFIGFEISYLSGEKMPTKLNEKRPMNFARSLIYGVISRGNSKNKFEVLYSDIEGTKTSDGELTADGKIKLNSPSGADFYLLSTKKEPHIGNAQFIISQFNPPNYMLQSRRTYPLVLVAERNTEFLIVRTGNIETNTASLALITAAKSQDIRGVLKAIFEGANINFQSPEDGKTALHWAMHNFDTDLLYILGIVNFGSVELDIMFEKTDKVYFDLTYKKQLLRQARHKLRFGIRDNDGYLPSRLLRNVRLKSKSDAEKLKDDLFKHCYHEELVELLNSGEDFASILVNPTNVEPFPNIIWGNTVEDDGESRFLQNDGTTNLKMTQKPLPSSD